MVSARAVSPRAVSPRAYRLCFALGSGALAAAVLLGVAGAFRAEGTLPPLLQDPLVEARRHYRKQDPERWIDEARALTRIMPRNRRAFVSLGMALADAGRFDPAIEALERAQAMGDVPGHAHARLAALYAAKGRKREAREQVQLAAAKGVSVSGGILDTLGPPGARP